jgi:hypothetical protein
VRGTQVAQYKQQKAGAAAAGSRKASALPEAKPDVAGVQTIANRTAAQEMR